MTRSRLLFLSGCGAMLGGALRIAAAFIPWRSGSPGLEALAFVIDASLLFGLAGIYLRDAARLGTVAAIGFAVAWIGLASILGPDGNPFGIDVYAVGSAVLALGLAAMAVPMLRRRVHPVWIPALWIATPVSAVVGTAAGFGEAGVLVAGVAFGAAFFGAGRELVRPADGPTIDLNQVTLPALDLRESVDFYTRFGLRLIVDSPENQYARFEIPGSDATLSLHVEPEPVRGPAAWIYFESASPKDVVARLREAGIVAAEPLEAKPWLWQEAAYRDPAGNRLLVYHAGENRKNPPWRLEA